MNRNTVMLAGGLATAVLWELAGRMRLLGESFPPLSMVFAYLVAPAHDGALLDAARQTASEALIGLAIGCSTGVILASIATLIPPSATGLGALASLVNGIPVVALAGVCVLTLPREATPLVVSALHVSFVVFVGAAGGLAAASAVHRDLFAVYGARRGVTFTALLFPAALPAIADAIRSAIPLAVVGAIVGEWFASERGLGPLLVAAMQNFAIAQLWAAAIVCALLSMTGYGVLGLLRAKIVARFAE